MRRKWPDVSISEAVDFADARSLAESEQPILCLVDLMMPGADPREGVAGILSAAPRARVLVLTGVQDDELMLDLLDIAHVTALVGGANRTDASMKARTLGLI